MDYYNNRLYCFLLETRQLNFCYRIILRIVATSYAASSLYKGVKEGCSSYLNPGLLIGAGIGLVSVILSL